MAKFNTVSLIVIVQLALAITFVSGFPVDTNERGSSTESKKHHGLVKAVAETVIVNAVLDAALPEVQGVRAGVAVARFAAKEYKKHKAKKHSQQRDFLKRSWSEWNGNVRRDVENTPVLGARNEMAERGESGSPNKRYFSSIVLEGMPTDALPLRQVAWKGVAGCIRIWIEQWRSHVFFQYHMLRLRYLDQ
ncbi:hypothetical protein F5887DRAFT_981983 [Amanita rubescens]|nr:hypothetical protein F5887DRAFT_1012172 [Amanita rubescens]KAF8338606.1 hypothetical protein F5887DRAFT_981983 [Amanita rubescens]